MPPGELRADHSVRGCPAEILSEPMVAATIQAWTDWTYYGESGYPFPGGLLDQPAWMTDAFRVLTATSRRQSLWYAEEAKRDADSGA